MKANNSRVSKGSKKRLKVSFLNACLKSTLKFISILIRIVVLACVFIIVLSDVATATNVKPIVLLKTKDLQKVLEKYSNALSIQADIKKTDEKIILGSTSESQGVFKFQKDKIYILQNNDKKTEVFYMNKILTLVEYPDVDFAATSDLKNGSKRKVTILKKAAPPLIKNLLNFFSSPKNFNNEFSMVSEKLVGDFQNIELKSNQKNIKNLNLRINTKNLELVELSFVDDVSTRTTLLFSNQKLNSKMNKGEFQYKQLTTDEVINE